MDSVNLKLAPIFNKDRQVLPKQNFILSEENNIKLQLEYLHEKIIAAESLKQDTQNEIKKYLRKQYDNIQGDITKLIYYCTHLESENKKLDDTLTQMTKHHFDKIDNVKDTIRRLTLIETELECQMQRLKIKLVDLEETNERQAKFIKALDGKFSEIGAMTMKELQEQVIPIQEESRSLDRELFALKRQQEELAGTLQHKERLLKIERTQQESDIKRLSANIQTMDIMRKEILDKIHETKSQVKQNSMKEMKKISKMTEVWRDLAERHRNVYKEKMQAENENTYLKEKISKLNDEINLKYEM